MSKWFEKHPEFLERESKQLQSNSNYIEEFQERNELFVSCGYFTVRFNGETLEYPVAIVYAEATPYALPRIFLLRQNLTSVEASELASKKGKEVSDFMTYRIAFYFKRHQNMDGSLCLLEQDNVDRDGVEAFDANEVLRRTHQWFLGLHTGVFPKDSAEVELVAHYPNRLETHFLLPEDFYSGDGVKGEYYCIPNGRHNSGQIAYAVGACINVQSISGISISPSDQIHSWMPERLQTILEIEKNNTLVTEKLNNAELIKGNWWHLDHEPSIYRSIFELAVDLDNKNGIEVLSTAIKDQLTSRNDIIYLGIRFKNRRNEIEWLHFALLKMRDENMPLIRTNESQSTVLKDYDLFAIYSEKFTEESLFLRNEGRLDHSILKEKSISLVGCGALGSEIADCFGKAGIGTLGLNDYQVLRAHNIVRHLADIRYTGQNKVHAVFDIVKSHNRFIDIRTAKADVLSARLNDFTLPDGVLVSSIADDNTEAYLNELAIEAKRTVYYVRGLRGGKAARIFKVIPNETACFYCLSLYKSENNLDYIVVPEDDSLPTIKNECNNPIRPASAADLKLIASMASRIILDDIQGKSKGKKNHWVWITEPELGLGATEDIPEVLVAKKLEPHSNCPVCRPRPSKVKIKKSVLQFMQEQTLATPGIETGGVLVGKIENGVLAIEGASGAGPKAIVNRTEFIRDVEFCQNYLNERSREGLRYIGEWHSHPDDDNSPSPKDLKSLNEVAEQKNYLTTSPVMIIFSKSGEPSTTLHEVGGKFYKVELDSSQLS